LRYKVLELMVFINHVITRTKNTQLLMYQVKILLASYVTSTFKLLNNKNIIL